MKKTKEARRNKGITLIALVITIIILLILAGISIATLTGDNGIITSVKTAKINTAAMNWELSDEEFALLNKALDKLED